MSLSDQSKRVLTEDCGNANGISIFGFDEGFIYYVHREGTIGGRTSVTGTSLRIYRVPRTAVK